MKGKRLLLTKENMRDGMIPSSARGGSVRDGGEKSGTKGEGEDGGRTSEARVDGAVDHDDGEDVDSIGLEEIRQLQERCARHE